MKAKLLSAAKKLAAIATSAMFLGVTVGAASAYSMSSLPSPFMQNGHVNATFVVGANAAPVDIIGAIAIATGLTAAAGSSHSGSGSFATIGKLVTTSKSSTSLSLGSESALGTGATFPTFSKTSLTVNAKNFTIGSTHYAAIENVTFSSTHPYINPNLGVTFPPLSVTLTSYVAAGNTTAVGATQNFTKGLQYLIGNTMYTFISNATFSAGANSGYLANVSLGAMQTFNNVKIPSTLTVGTNTIDVQSVGSEAFSSKTYNTIDVSINGGSTQVLNLSGTYTNVNGTGVTITVGPSYSTVNGVTTLDYLEASSVGITQNVTSNTKGDANLFGLGSNYNATYLQTFPSHHGIANTLVFLNTNNITLPYSFSAANSFELPVNLTSISLEKLTPTWGNTGNEKNITVVTGASATDAFTPVVQQNTSAAGTTPLGASLKVVSFNATHNLPTISYGIDFRGSTVAANSSGYYFYSTPDLLLEHYQKVYTGTSPYQFLVGKSEYLFPYATHTAFNISAPTGLTTANAKINFNSTTGKFYNVTTTSVTPAVVYELPNGENIALKFTPVFNTNYTNTTAAPFVAAPTYKTVYLAPAVANSTERIWNVSTILNYTSSTTSSPGVNALKLGKAYTFGGYNVTFSLQKVTLVDSYSTVSGKTYYGTKNASIVTMTIKGPVSSVTTANAANSFAIVPGTSGLYASNGTTLSSATNGVLGSVAFNGNDVVFTEPTGTAISIPIKENTTNFATYFPTVKNATADTWGTVVNFNTIPKYGNSSSYGTLKINVPSENYSLLVSGSQAISSLVNYSIGASVPAGVLKFIGGVSPVSASSLVSGFQMPTLDTSFTASSNSVPVIVVGGPAVNKIAAELLTGSSTPIHGAQFQNLTGVGPNEALVEYFSNSSAVGNQPALLVAGYYGNDTQIASEALYESLIGTPVVSINGTKVVLSVSSLSLSGVTVVS
ncbi:hypothetical protein IHI26_01690 [Candidatus Parvarchaeota archaeon]|nr:hypothetical protein [Candidatus Acidifodinimicrobium mancum]MBE5730025.1 hypothetical protein [Candidatus Acidifodinimicrobium mancum]